MFSTKKTTVTTPAQKRGFSYRGTSPTEGISVNPYTRPVNSPSAMGLVARLTTTVTTTQTTKDPSAGRPLPEHSEYDGTKQGSNEEAEQCLHVIHDAGELHHQVRRTHADQHAYHCGPATHVHVMMVAALAIDERTVDVIRPDGRERAHISRHSRHEARDQCRNSKAEQPGTAIAGKHKWEHVVVAVASSYSRHRFRNQFHRQYGQAQQSGQDHDDWNQHLESSPDNRRHFRAANIFRGQDEIGR